MLDVTGDLREEDEVVKWGILLAFGLAKELRKTYQGTSAERAIVRQSQPLVNQIEKVMPRGVPTFLAEEYPEKSAEC